MEDVPEPEYCDFCRLPRHSESVTAEVDGDTYEFCSEHCRNAMLGADRVFTRYHGHRRFAPGVAGLDAVLPQGCPRNSFVLLSAQPGTRDMAIEVELVWRALQRGEPAVMVTFQEPPSSLVERFATFDWNVLPYLERGQLRVVDCFTYRMTQSAPSPDHTSAWSSHLADAVAPATERVRDPSDVAEVTNKIESALDDSEMVETGLVVLDSLTELGTLVQPVRAYDFVKDLRANVAKARFVPVIAAGTLLGDQGEFPHDLAYVADGIVDLQLEGEIVEDELIKRLRVRKLSGVLSYQRWTAFEYTAGQGMVTFDPRETDAEAGEAEDERSGGQQSAAAGDGSGGAPAGATDGSGQSGDGE